MADPSEGAELTNTSGDVCLARLRASPQPLSMVTLQGVRDGLERSRELDEELGSCLDLALDKICQEPQCVQENARLLIQWDEGKLEFVAGQGQCEISVSCSTGEPQYHITEKTWDVYMAWMNSHPEPLSIKNLQSVRNTLEHWGALEEELSSCFGEAISQFSREPRCVQENATMLIQWGRGELTFTSGNGECEISVCCVDRKAQYNVVKIPVHVYLAQLRTHQQPLSADTLQRVLRELGSCHGDSGALRACFDRAWQGFSREPRCVQENARLLIRWDGGKLEFISGQGQCEISVLLTAGKLQYHITELGGDKPVTLSHTSPEPLSVADLARVRDRLGRWGALGEELSSCFGEAISQFSQEPRCVQENARLLIQWDGQELEFVSGQGQCEISVLLDNEEPQYHITEPGGETAVTWSHTSPEPLSVADLARVWDRLEHWGALGEELSGCFEEAISQFSQEPPCVQGNARMRIRWDGGTLELLSGKGQCEISVCCRDGRPQYEVGELHMHMYVARLCAHPEPLSADTLQRVLRKLGSCKGDIDDLRACFHHAWEGFRQEPRYVQENSRLLIQWGGEELRFTSGKGECEISVRCGDGEPQYHVRKIPVHVYLAQLRAHQQSLSADTLQRVLRELGSCHGDTGALEACFDRAWQGFRQEPRCVQENARLLIRWGGGELELISGQGQCEISVLLADGDPHYRITEPVRDRPVTWSHTSPEPLSVTDLERVRERLRCWGELGEELSSCFGEAISHFSQEPPCVQENARMRIWWGTQSLEFLSGEGQYIFSVSYQEGNPLYYLRVETLPVHLYVARLRSHKDPLSADSLLKFHAELGLCQGDTAAPRACLYRVWEGFSQEPRCVQENARLLIQWRGQELEFVSGQGQCEISVFLADGEPQYHITELGRDRPVTWSHARPEPLSVANLARVRDRLGRWGALGEELSGCFGEAISQFSREPRCVQENARMGIQWDGQELQFVSGQGQCEISVFVADGEPQYHITELGGDRPVTWSHTSPEPLSVADLARVWDRLRRWGALGERLSSCFREAISQFSREPPCVQKNARMRIRWDGGTLELLSGKGQCEISMCCRDGRPQYEVGELPVGMYLDRLRIRPEPLSADTLQRVQDKLRSCKGNRENLIACFDCALEGFVQEPQCVQENARLLIRCGKWQVKFTSGKAECELSVRYGGGKPQYRAMKTPVHVCDK